MLHTYTLRDDFFLKLMIWNLVSSVTYTMKARVENPVVASDLDEYTQVVNVNDTVHFNASSFRNAEIYTWKVNTVCCMLLSYYI